MRHTIDRDLTHLALLVIVEECIRIEVAIASHQRPLLVDAPLGSNISTISLGTVHILVLANEVRIVRDKEITRCLRAWDRHEGDHIVEEVGIPRDTHIDNRIMVLDTTRDVTTGLCLQVWVA